MKPPRRRYAGEADPSSVSEAYERYLAEQALEAAPKVLQKLVRDGYVFLVVGQLTTRQSQYRLFLYGPAPCLLSYWPGNGDRTYTVRDPSMQDVLTFSNAYRAASVFRAIVEERTIGPLLEKTYEPIDVRWPR